MADLGHLETDALIKDLEARVRREYSQATKELTAKLDDYFRRFEVKDEKWRIMVANGEKTVEEYQKWRIGQMMVGKRWEDMRDSVAEDLHNTNLIARGMLTGKMPDAYALNHNWSTYDIERAGRVNTGYTLYNRDTVERILVEQPDLLKPPGVQMKKTFADWDAYINKDLGNIEDQIGQIRAAYPQGNMPAGVQAQLNRLEKEKRSFDKLMADGKDIRWQKGQIQSVTLQAVLQGESIPNMARRIAKTRGEMNRKASVRYARTAMTSAQNSGRRDAYKRAQGLGIDLQQEWIATLDFRTRHAHRQLDGQIRDIDEPFQVDGYDIEFPGDPAAPGYLVYNCRCTTAAKVAGWDSMSGKLRSDEAIEGMSYEEWKEGHSQPQDILNQQQTSDAMRQRTIRDLYSETNMNDSATDALSVMYERHRIDNDLTSVPYDQLGKYSANVVSADFGSMSAESAKVFTDTIRDLSSQYDTPLTKIRTITADEFLGHKDAFAYVRHNYSTDTAEMVINQAKCKEAKALADRITELSGRGYCVSVLPGTEAQYVATHEFAHTILNLQDKLSNKTNYVGADYEKIITARKDIEGIYKRYTTEMSRLDKARWDATNQVLFATSEAEMQKAGELARNAQAAYNSAKISDYSLSNADDFMAEAFVNETIGTTSNPYAKEVVKVLTRYFGR